MGKIDKFLTDFIGEDPVVLLIFIAFFIILFITNGKAKMLKYIALIVFVASIFLYFMLKYLGPALF